MWRTSAWVAPHFPLWRDWRDTPTTPSLSFQPHNLQIFSASQKRWSGFRLGDDFNPSEQNIPTWELTYPQTKGTFESMIFLFWRLDNANGSQGWVFVSPFEELDNIDVCFKVITHLMTQRWGLRGQKGRHHFNQTTVTKSTKHDDDWCCGKTDSPLKKKNHLAYYNKISICHLEDHHGW